jgi:hypothetical protein
MNQKKGIIDKVDSTAIINFMKAPLLIPSNSMPLAAWDHRARF